MSGASDPARTKGDSKQKWSALPPLRGKATGLLIGEARSISEAWCEWRRLCLQREASRLSDRPWGDLILE